MKSLLNEIRVQRVAFLKIGVILIFLLNNILLFLVPPNLSLLERAI